MRKGFTMIELVMVIVVVGILGGIAIPKFLETRNSADIAKGKSILFAVRGAMSAEKQNRFMNGDNTPITSLGAGGDAFSVFSADGDGVSNKVLEYPVPSCQSAGCWSGGDNGYTYYLPDGTTCNYVIDNGIFVAPEGCAKLER